MSTRSSSTIDTDIAIVGGGVAGSSLGGALAREGLGVTIVEREATFRDRVRGEGIISWGVHEADQLGVLPMLRDAGAIEARYWQTYDDRKPRTPFDLTKTTDSGHGALNMYHPLLQSTLLDFAEQSGATVIRPAKATSLRATTPPELAVNTDAREVTIRARLVVGADGRTSAVRRWAGIETIRDPVHHRVGGCLLEDVALDETSIHLGHFFDGGFSLIFPQADNRARAYIACNDDVAQTLMGTPNRDRFLPFAARSLPDGAIADSRLSGPIAFFPNADIWAKAPATASVALIGDAAGANDPTIGQGLSLALRDARLLRDLLLDSSPGSKSNHDWKLAVSEYARRRATYFEVVRLYAQWFATLWVEFGPEADARRERVERIREIDPSSGAIGVIPFSGPDGVVLDEDTRRRFFGEHLQVK